MLFKNAFSIETMVLDDGMTGELEGHDHGLIEVLFQHLPLVVEENHENP
jgi:hypothetical protein